jgi:hypothetical protein
MAIQWLYVWHGDRLPLRTPEPSWQLLLGHSSNGLRAVGYDDLADDFNNSRADNFDDFDDLQPLQ